MELKINIYSPQTARDKTNFSIIMALGINNLYEASELIDNGILTLLELAKLT